MRFLVRLLLFLLVIIVAAPAALVVALNSKAGREFVVTQVNQRSGGMLRLNGLGGHFPAISNSPGSRWRTSTGSG